LLQSLTKNSVGCVLIREVLKNGVKLWIIKAYWHEITIAEETGSIILVPLLHTAHQFQCHLMALREKTKKIMQASNYYFENQLIYRDRNKLHSPTEQV
jgi:hypothetical protein